MHVKNLISLISRNRIVDIECIKDISKCKSLLLILSMVLLLIFLLPSAGMSSNARELYIQADLHYKKLSGSQALKKKETEWLNCINLYERVYRRYPDNLWAPVSMYKAAQINILYAKFSGKNEYREQAADLLAKLRNRYQNSTYDKKAQTLLRTMSVTQVNLDSLISKSSKPKATPKPGALPPNAPPNISSRKLQIAKAPPKNTQSHISPRKQLITKSSETKTLNHIKANKELIRKPGSMQDMQSVALQTKAMRKSKDQLVKAISLPSSSPKNTPVGNDTQISGIRFWSGGEYTRLVIDVDQEREYSHFLLKKDPKIKVVFKRLCIDIENSVVATDFSEQNIDDNFIFKARAGQLQPHTVRVVMDIKSFDNYKIFSLKEPFRIVVDIWGKNYHESPPAKTANTKEKYTTTINTDNLKSSAIARQLALHVKTIVIDPGHGGADPGAPGYYKGMWEKDVVLKISKKLKTVLQKRLQTTIFLTRNDDRKLTLEERTAIANTKRADLFISIHCNAARNRKLKGIETYFLNLATDKHAIAVAARENATSEKNISDLDYILTDLMKYAKIEESSRLANSVHKGFTGKMKAKYSGTNDLGIKQAPFYVLLGAKMPAILVETAFISNPTEGKRLRSDKYLQTIANSIAHGIEQYIETTNPKKISRKF